MAATQRLQPGPNTNAAGGVVNPADPAALVKADILLQRQNETVVAASIEESRSPAGRGQRLPLRRLPGRPEFRRRPELHHPADRETLPPAALGKPLPIRATGGPVGAWTGVYRSCDRGRTWIGSALPGGPLDNSPASQFRDGSASPLKDLSDEATLQGGHAETTDPFLMAGPGGRMHMVVLGFVRFPNGSVGNSRMYYASYTDRNNRRRRQLLQLRLHAPDRQRGQPTSARARPHPFIDKPSMAVDKDGIDLSSATPLFTDSREEQDRDRAIDRRRRHLDEDDPAPEPGLPAQSRHDHGNRPANGVVYVAWRLFYQNWPLMVVSRSFDRGKTFLPATPISHWWPAKSLDAIVTQLKAAKLQPFDQFSETPGSPIRAQRRRGRWRFPASPPAW